MTAAMAVRLGAAFGTTPDLRRNAQQACDLHRAVKSARRLPRPLLHSG